MHCSEKYCMKKEVLMGLPVSPMSKINCFVPMQINFFVNHFCLIGYDVALLC